MSLKLIDLKSCRGAIAATLVVLAGCASGPASLPDPVAASAVSAYPADASDRYARALGLIDAGEAGKAADMLRVLAADYPDYAGPLINLAMLAADNGNADEAMALLVQALEICENCAPAWNQAGILHREAGRFGAAEDAYLHALAADPDYALAYYNLGVLYDLYYQRPELAVEHYERYVALAADMDSAEKVAKWITDLRLRIGDQPRTAQAGETT